MLWSEANQLKQHRSARCEGAPHHKKLPRTCETAGASASVAARTVNTTTETQHLNAQVSAHRALEERTDAQQSNGAKAQTALSCVRERFANLQDRCDVSSRRQTASRGAMPHARLRVGQLRCSRISAVHGGLTSSGLMFVAAVVRCAIFVGRCTLLPVRRRLFHLTRVRCRL